MQLFDNHGRALNYLRLAVTDRCNLRCFYCMPESGIKYLPKSHLLTFEEIERLVRISASMGITKIRLTGGEPFVRNDLMKLVRKITHTPGIHDVHLTTNGVLTAPHIPELKALGIASMNLSLDTLDRGRFKAITHRDEFETVWATFHKLLDAAIPIKINAVVMDEKNIEDILPLIELTRDYPVAVRFIEEMPFNGEGTHYPVLRWTHIEIMKYISSHYPSLIKLTDEAYSTSMNYSVPGYIGSFGVIAAYSRTFCGTCNRIRVTAQGTLKTCLYDNGVLDIKNLLRITNDDEVVKKKLLLAFGARTVDGFEAETKSRQQQPIAESMSTIGG